MAQHNHKIFFQTGRYIEEDCLFPRCWFSPPLSAFYSRLVFLNWFKYENSYWIWLGFCYSFGKQYLMKPSPVKSSPVIRLLHKYNRCSKNWYNRAWRNRQIVSQICWPLGPCSPTHVTDFFKKKHYFFIMQNLKQHSSH